MINKKNVLGKTPHELGDKDAIHVAIVAVRAATLIKPGQRCRLNEHREAVPDAKGVGVADPFMPGNATTGESFWLLLAQDEVPNVRHVWEHPSVDFSPPTREVAKNRWLVEFADNLGVTYEQLMAACGQVVETYKSAPYPGSKSRDELDKAMDNMDAYTLWGEWAEETGYEFENTGSACCPEYEHPEVAIFKLPD